MDIASTLLAAAEECATIVEGTLRLREHEDPGVECFAVHPFLLFDLNYI